MRRWFLNFFGALLWRKYELNILLASKKTLFEDPYSNPLQNACCSIQEFLSAFTHLPI
jgi:hypothetical protein